MKFSNNLILKSNSITARSGVHAENMEALARGLNFWVDAPLNIDRFTLDRHGKISDSLTAELLDSFDIKPKNKKYFERSSTLLFSVIKDYGPLLKSIDGSEVGLYCGVGPANARIDDFREWAAGIEGADEFYPSMMASSVIKLLPNIVMSNLSINTGWRGENAIFSSCASAFFDALNSLLTAFENGSSRIAAAGSVSAPFEYFNMDSYSRFFGADFFDPPLCETASSMLLCTPDFYAGRLENTGMEPEGRILSIDSYKTPEGLFKRSDIKNFEKLARDFLESENYDFTDTLYFKTHPAACGNFLTGGEPVNVMSLVYSLNAAGEKGFAVSVNIDYFGNLHAVKAGGRASQK
ncbi:MAG: hypothetical protein BWY32_01020 [bacterium ADurb.Bin243]|nr:MAG: hypothetical protein BWY32_01020 [bacterium ADurb.Bin243]